MLEKERQNLITSNPLQTVLFIAVIVGSFLIGSLWTKIQILEKGGVATKTVVQPSGDTTGQAPPAPGPNVANVQIDQVRDAFTKSQLKFGDVKKKVIFIEIADPSCPFCHVAVGLNSELEKTMGDQFKSVANGGSYIPPVPEMKKLVDSGKAAFAWLYTPGHGSGEMATKAMYCANEKGKFWQVHDKLMTNDGYNLINNTVKNDKTKAKELTEFLKSVYNPSDLLKCLDSGKYDGRLQEDVTLAKGLGVTGTPGFFVNTKVFPGAFNWKDIEPEVKSSL